ncbi:uncharacterized protein [Montipora capricornis]|uniref:uncharacterized protein isoform X3 n=1 Tax=Montipora capricornis TaxID=246305 RepID=UPI0035F1A52A
MNQSRFHCVDTQNRDYLSAVSCITLSEPNNCICNGSVVVQRLREETRVVEYAIQYYKDIRTTRITEEWHVTRQFDAANKKRLNDDETLHDDTADHNKVCTDATCARSVLCEVHSSPDVTTWILEAVRF